MQNSYNKRWVLGLLLGCPLSKPNCQCPLNELREKSCEELINIVEQYSMQETESIIHYHKECFELREKTMN